MTSRSSARIAGAAARMSRKSSALDWEKSRSRRFAAFLQASRRAFAAAASSGSSPPPRTEPRRGKSTGSAERRASQPSRARTEAERRDCAVPAKLPE